jgi:hypothetical protein
VRAALFHAGPINSDVLGYAAKLARVAGVR